MPEDTREVAILGSTGSIGTQALDVISRNTGRFDVVALAAGANTRLLAQQVAATGARIAGIASDGGTAENPDQPPLAQALAEAGVHHEVEILTGPTAAEQIAAEAPGAAAPAADGVVLNGMTGSIGLRPTLAALGTGATLALANKESLVVGGALVQAAQTRPGQIVPVDSEHSALAQALTSGRHEKGMCAVGRDGALSGDSEVRRLIVTASGGPFRDWPVESLSAVTPAEALKHPNFDMGRVVTTNSATLVNKALEVIEAHLLFDIPLDDIETVIHPQQIIHSLVEFQDGSTLAQAGPPRMLVPIALGLSWPERLAQVDEPIDWTQIMQWDFEPLDHERFPAVRLAKQACAASATHMSVYNAANEQAVDAFHEGKLGFGQIVETVEQVLADHEGHRAEQLSLEDVIGAEIWARRRADQLIGAGVYGAGAGVEASRGRSASEVGR
ncbi:1-deoxy-D-xylulose-5-phosphate reductoisomerase [Nesterenkonia lacusekhoensis]|uniref:1-deoxy-D-xylulose 5-phosphate reductoisomerase n=1 Tax=Nesterenkonia lacusekhoensis TaxID=150832 RepID=A0ABS4T3K8_9MICC|nr:1-deoxy-D-xylulose-5-phosphate reductoisomerase [Nesterenkonia lacusekhoensis]MBP2318564.1 1-deoxy-D-xylulose-5-phosphate reductoisomerase [Nesterenkonia lacusekhoensis]